MRLSIDLLKYLTWKGSIYDSDSSFETVGCGSEERKGKEKGGKEGKQVGR